MNQPALVPQRNEEISARPVLTMTRQRKNEAWELKFRMLSIFLRTHGHCDVPPTPRADSLYAWLEEQRKKHRAGTLPAERVERLSGLGAVRGLEPEMPARATADLEARWEARFNELAAYKERFGHCDVPAGWKENKGLGAWLVNQRRKARQGRLNADHKKRLLELGMVSEGRPIAVRAWEQRFSQLLAFKERFGHCNVPSKWKEDVAFGSWVHFQRAFKRRGTLSEERIRRLEEIGFLWMRGDFQPVRFSELGATARGEMWEARFQELQAWKDRQFAVPPAENRSLAGWICNQRELYHAGQMPPERQQRLEEAGFPWEANVRKQNWEERFRQLIAYKQRFGHCHVPAKWQEDVPFGQWVHVQRAFKRRGQLSEERSRRLEEIGFQWMRDDFVRLPSSGPGATVRNEMWEARLEELRAWKSRKFLVPPAENPRLSKWLIKQRALHNAGQLPPERERRLEELGVPWEPVGQYTDLWEERFKELLAFKKKFGHCNIPARWKENIQLGTWVANLRAFHRRGKLSGERITRLDAIGFDWIPAMLRKSA